MGFTLSSSIDILESYKLINLGAIFMNLENLQKIIEKIFS